MLHREGNDEVSVTFEGENMIESQTDFALATRLFIALENLIFDTWHGITR